MGELVEPVISCTSTSTTFGHLWRQIVQVWSLSQHFQSRNGASEGYLSKFSFCLRFGQNIEVVEFDRKVKFSFSIWPLLKMWSPWIWTNGQRRIFFSIWPFGHCNKQKHGQCHSGRSILHPDEAQSSLDRKCSSSTYRPIYGPKAFQPNQAWTWICCKPLPSDRLHSLPARRQTSSCPSVGDWLQ